MEMEEHSYRILLVSSSEKFNTSVLPILTGFGHPNIATVSSCSAARRAVLETDYDLVFINAPLPDEFGTKMALDISSSNHTGILLFVKADLFPETNARVTPYGILTISKPTSVAFISQSISILLATRERLRRMEQRTASIEDKMEEIRLVNRAKWVLIEQLNMTEPEAHRFIEKKAMDRCQTKREIAKWIINNQSRGEIL